jgi:hypothetical protein
VEADLDAEQLAGTEWLAAGRVEAGRGGEYRSQARELVCRIEGSEL